MAKLLKVVPTGTILVIPGGRAVAAACGATALPLLAADRLLALPD